MIIGITGGIGSGKTTLANGLRSKGFLVYDSDKEARRLQNENVALRQKLMDEFGSDIYNENGLNRSKLGEIVFRDKKKLHRLNQIVHPAVMQHVESWVRENNTQKLLFIESAILFESGFDALVDKVILVTANEELRINRVVERDAISPEEVKKRISNQASDDKKLSKADIVIRTDIDEPLDVQINEILTLFD